eukprot:15356176-Ditylum_brightwellii.AAC.1
MMSNSIAPNTHGKDSPPVFIQGTFSVLESIKVGICSLGGKQIKLHLAIATCIMTKTVSDMRFKVTFTQIL